MEDLRSLVLSGNDARGAGLLSPDEYVGSDHRVVPLITRRGRWTRELSDAYLKRHVLITGDEKSMNYITATPIFLLSSTSSL